MEYTNLGRTGLKVSRLCLGTVAFGWQTDEKESFQIMDKALELEFNFFDTANVYGYRMGKGSTEQIIGRWLSQGSGRREKIVLATKVYKEMSSGVNDKHLSAYHIRQACEESLRRLQTDHIDLYQMHHIDRETPWEEIWQAMEQLVQQGKIIYVGSSNFAGWNIAQANDTAAARNSMGLVSEQSKYSLMDRMVELEVIPACREYGLGLIPWSCLSGGLLAGNVFGAKEGRRAEEDSQKKAEQHRSQLEKYETLCKDLNENPAIVAFAWLLKNPAVTAPIIGPRTIKQLDGSMQALKMDLGDDAMAELEKIWPGPGGEAPEAYAW